MSSLHMCILQEVFMQRKLRKYKKSPTSHMCLLPRKLDNGQNENSVFYIDEIEQYVSE